MAASDDPVLDFVPHTGRGISAVLEGPIPAGMSFESVETRRRDDPEAQQGLAWEGFLPA
jgi:hypothetical protein